MAVISLHAVVGYGIVPGVAPGASVSASGALSRRFSLTAGATLFPSTALSPSPSQLSLAAMGLWLGASAAIVKSESLLLSACGTFVGGVLTPRSLLRVPTDTQDRAWVAATVGLRFQVRIVGPLSLEIGADAMIPFVRYQFVSHGTPTVEFDQSPVAVVGFLGPLMAF